MEVRTKKGDVLTKRLSHAKGSNVNPLSREEVIKKFEYLTRTVFDDKRKKCLFDTIMSFEKLDDIRSFSELLKA